jgi:hypothetical protein
LMYFHKDSITIHGSIDFRWWDENVIHILFFRT